MKKWVMGTVAALVITTVALTTFVGAQTFKSGDTSTISKDEVVDGSAFLAGSSINVEGRVDGDLYCAGQNIVISGQVTGDVLCAGQTIDVSGDVAGDVRLAGQTVTLRGTVGGNASLAGQQLSFETNGRVNKDFVAVGQAVALRGAVGRDAVLTGSTTTISSTVGRNVTAEVELLTLTSSAAVNGSMNYTAPQQLAESDEDRVVGEVTYTPREERKANYETGYNVVGALIGSLMFIITALLIALLVPRLLHNVTAPSVKSFSQTMLAVLVGFIACIVVPVFAVLFMFTIVAIPFVFIVFIAWALVLVVSGFFTAYYIGRIAWRKQSNILLVTMTGSLIIAFLLLIPFVNVFVFFMSVWYGSGALLLYVKTKWMTPRYSIEPISKTKMKA